MVVMIVGLATFVITCLVLLVFYARSRVVPSLHPLQLKTKDYVVTGLNSTRLTIAEDIFRFRAAFWDRPCLDSTLHAVDTLRALREIEFLHADRAKLKDGFLTIGVWPVQNTKGILERFWDEGSGAFKQWEYSWADTYSIDVAFRFISDLTHFETPKREAIDLLFGDWIKRCCEFINDSYDKKSGMFFDTPYGGKASIATTFSVLSAIDALVRMDFKDKADYCLESKKLDIDNMLKDYGRSSDSSFAFANTHDGNSLLCATYYAMRILYYFIPEKLGEKINNRGILKFMDSCWVEGLGGYARTPGGDPTLLHTRYALGVMRILLRTKLIAPDEIREILKPSRILDYVNSCRRGNGFGIARGVSPSIYGTRVATKIVKSLYLLESVMGDAFPRSAQYEEKIEDFYIRKETIKEFIELCHEADTLCFAGFPLR
jgi:prenyltransferase beta subunit